MRKKSRARERVLEFTARPRGFAEDEARARGEKETERSGILCVVLWEVSLLRLFRFLGEGAREENYVRAFYWFSCARKFHFKRMFARVINQREVE